MSLPLDLEQAMKGKVVLITGANSGIGKETAQGLAKMGASLVLVCRDREKGEAVKEEIARATGNASIELFLADLLPQREVRRVAAEIKATHPRLDVLVNNAGASFTDYAETEDGIERTMAINYFTPFLLTNLLLETLKNSAPSRVVNVTSSEHYDAHLDLDNVNRDSRMGTVGSGAYARSKLAVVLFTYELARRLLRSGVTANCLHPGAVRTNIWRHAGALTPLFRFMSVFMLSAGKGAQTSIYLASSPEVEGASGKYFDKKLPKRSSETSYDEAIARRLWELSERMTGLAAAPGARSL
jgi:NAD(P)-dependent dehydrogenase (short-subunit alcohol dehydrogenase family)